MRTLIHILTIAAACMISGAKIETVPNDAGAKTYSIRKTGNISREQAQELRREAGKNGIEKVFVDRELCWIIFITDACTTPAQVRRIIERTGVSV